MAVDNRANYQALQAEERRAGAETEIAITNDHYWQRAFETADHCNR